LRVKSAVLTGGLANPAISSGELGGAVGVSLLALASPLIAVALVAVFCFFALRTVRRLFRKRPAAEDRASSTDLRPQ
jgi:TRAP-type C4-dicarboxylate transport system permease small subunit